MRSPPHKRLDCEIAGCVKGFRLGGRHHCRECGKSVCSEHFLRPRCVECAALRLTVRQTAAEAALSGLDLDENTLTTRLPAPIASAEVEPVVISDKSSIMTAACGIARWPADVVSYTARLRDAFGVQYLVIVGVSYGVNQGLTKSFSSFAALFLFTDEPPAGFGLSNASVAALTVLTQSPWAMTALCGALSDVLSICGYHRTPYILLASLVGFYVTDRPSNLPTSNPRIVCAKTARTLRPTVCKPRV